MEAVLAFLHPSLGALSCDDTDARGAIQKQHAGKRCEDYILNWKHVRSALQQVRSLRPWFGLCVMMMLRQRV